MVTEEMMEAAWCAFKLSQTSGEEYIPLVRALEAVAPMIRNAALEEAARVVDAKIKHIEDRGTNDDDWAVVEMLNGLAAAIRALAMQSPPPTQ